MPSRYQTWRKRDIKQGEIARLEQIQSDPYLMQGMNRAKLTNRIKVAKAKLEEITPPPIEGDKERAALIKRESLLRHAMVEGSSKLGIPPIPSHEACWKLAAGVTDRVGKWERTWKNKTLSEDGEVIDAPGKYGAVFEWKDIRKRLANESDPEATEVSNIKGLRPEKDSGRSFIDYPRMTFVGGMDHPTAHGLKTAPDAYPGWRLSEKGEPERCEHTFEHCQATTASGGSCKRKNLTPEVPFCGLAKHKEQFEAVGA